ncbi:hypothetical protein [Saccharicrinis fermentans]|nr:hypothetical protein [Saccharicrinis fermentans]
MSSCEPEEYDVPDIDLTSVYSIGETENNDLSTINIYRDKALLTVWNKDGAVTSFETKDYSDSSDDTNYLVTVTAVEEVTVVDGEGNESLATITYGYDLVASKETGVCNVSITTTNEKGEVSTLSISGTLVEKEIYN